MRAIAKFNNAIQSEKKQDFGICVNNIIGFLLIFGWLLSLYAKNKGGR